MSLVNKLNEFLANQQVFYVKLHNLHWYVVGPSFFTLHAKFEELYDESATIVDDVAERILALGGSPVASVKKASEIATIKELCDEKISGDDSVKALIEDVKFFNNLSKEIRSLAGEEGDGVTEDQFNNYVGAYEKLLWMLEAYLCK
jgi:starvation-inducible DNA-binding protein